MLEVVALNGSVQGLKLLLEHPVYGLAERSVDDDGRQRRLAITTRAMHNAVRGSYEALVYLLTKAGYPLPSQGGERSADLLTPAQSQVVLDTIPIAASLGPLSSLKLLLSYHFPFAEVEDGTFPVAEAWHESWTRGAYGSLEKDDADKLAYLYSFGIKEHDTMSMGPLPDGQTLNLQHLLELAAQQGSMKCARLLIDEYGANVNKMRVPPAGFPLYLATWRDKADMVRYLLEDCGADIHKGNGRYAAGPTALWSAINLKALNSIECLLKHGGPIDHIDSRLASAAAAGPVTAILQGKTEEGATVHLTLEKNVEGYIEDCRRNFQELNPMYVRLELGSDDQDLVRKLVPRLPNDELRDGIRQLDLSDEESACEISITEKLAPWPTDQKRQDELEEDDDVLPKWEPFLVSV